MRITLPFFVKTLFVLAGFSFFSSCEIINPDEEIPSYISINSISINTLSGQGSAKHIISDSWCYLDGDNLGTYELPAQFPVLAEGEKTVTIYPGVILNGIAGTRARYPFVNSIEQKITLKRGEILVLDSVVNLQTTYYSNTVFGWNDIGQEDFEEGGISIDSVSGSSTKMTRTTSDVFEGGYSGLVELTSTNSSFIGYSTHKYDLPTDGTPVYLELNYKTDVSLFIGYRVNYVSSTDLRKNLIEIVPKNTWNKIYFNLTPYLTEDNLASDFNIIFQAALSDSQTSGKLLLDNIKLVYKK